jgi:hypothetical protein
MSTAVRPTMAASRTTAATRRTAASRWIERRAGRLSVAFAARFWYQPPLVRNQHPAATALALLSLCALTSTAEAQRSRRRPPEAPPTPPPAAPAPPPAADPLEAEHAQGVELRRQHRDVEARDLFRALYERSHAARALAWQAGAEGALGDWVNAEQHLATALEDTADPWVNQLRAELTADLAGFRQHVGRLEILSNTPGAEVWLAGERVATLPLQRPLTVRSGPVAVEVRATGYVMEVHTVNVQPGLDSLARETVNLTPLPPPSTVGSVNVVPPSGALPAAPEPGGIHPLRIAGAIALGLGGVGVGVGTYGMINYSSLRTDYVNAGCDVASPPADCAGFDGGSGSLTLGVVGLVAGGALAVGGLVMLLVPVRSPRSSSVAVGSGPGDVGISLHGTF